MGFGKRKGEESFREAGKGKAKAWRWDRKSEEKEGILTEPRCFFAACKWKQLYSIDPLVKTMDFLFSAPRFLLDAQ